MISEQSRTLVGFNNQKNTVKSSAHELEDSNQGEDQKEKKKRAQELIVSYQAVQHKNLKKFRESRC